MDHGLSTCYGPRPLKVMTHDDVVDIKAFLYALFKFAPMLQKTTQENGTFHQYLSVFTDTCYGPRPCYGPWTVHLLWTKAIESHDT